MIRNMRTGLMIFTLAAMLFLSGSNKCEAYRAAGDQFKLKIKMSGTVTVTGKCEFNKKGPLEVDFGDVYFDPTSYQLLGTYTQPLISDMNCTGDTLGAKMTFSTAAATILLANQGIKVLAADAKKNIGIVLIVNGVWQNLGDSFPVDMANPPRLEAQLLQVKTGKLVSGQKISSSVTLKMEFD